MKTKLQLSPIVLALLMFGCATPLTTTQQTTDQIILDAEKTLQAARLTFDTFVRLERDNEALLKTINPAIHTYANTIRANGLNWVDSLSSAIGVFQANRTSTNQANLNTWLTTLTTAVNQSNQYITQAKSAGAK